MSEAVHVRTRGERYAFPVADVREVETRGELTPVPGAPATVAGIRNLRGSILPVVELSAALGLGTAEGATIVVAEADGLLAGLAVDEVLGVEPLRGALEPAPEEGGPLHGRVLVDGELVGLLDTAAVLRAVAEAT